ncbi:MAG: type III pantothenate kinase [Nitrospinae bacterium]|nr:type III pantothenate kinase [Nitrospinota bacterium]
MLLAIDIGNTNIVLGLYQRNKLIVHWRIETDRERTEDEYAALMRGLFSIKDLKFDIVKDVAVSCVVPPILSIIENLSKKYFNTSPLVVGPGIKTGIPILYDNPKEVGADRIVNAVAGYEKYGGPLIIVDFGTATTFDVVSQKGEYMGGVIAPGIGISMEALFERAAKLPKVELIKPETVIGRNTISSMQSGAIYGYAGLVDRIVEEIKKELGEKAFVAATGGLAEMVAAESKTIKEVNPFLTLEGLRIIFEKNTRKL